MRLGRQTCFSPPVFFFYLPFQGGTYFGDYFCYLCFDVCHAVLSVPCSLVVTSWEMADLLALLCVMFFCVIVTFPYGVLGRVWCLIVWISVGCLLPYFVNNLEGLQAVR